MKRHIFLGIILLVALTGVVSAHGGFSAVVLGDTHGIQGDETEFAVVLNTGEAPVGEDSYTATVQLQIDGETVENREVDIGHDTKKDVIIEHTFSDAGNHSVTSVTTFENSEWSTNRTAGQNIQIYERGSQRAYEQCMTDAVTGLDKLGCDNAHGDGVVSGIAAGHGITYIGGGIVIFLISGIVGFRVLRQD